VKMAKMAQRAAFVIAGEARQYQRQQE